MKIPRGVNARTFIRALRDDGFYARQIEESHHRFKHPDGRAVTVAYHTLSDTFTVKSRIGCCTIHAGPRAIFGDFDFLSKLPARVGWIAI